MTEQWIRSQAHDDYTRARRRALWEAAVDVLTRRPGELLPLEEIRSRLNVRGSHYLGLQQVPLAQVVGSEGRYADFDRRFLPRSEATAARWMGINQASQRQVMLPPVELYKIGDVYFVKDGNHRISVARERGQPDIDAYVTEYDVDVPLDPSFSMRDMILKEEYSDFLDWTGLARLRPEQRIELSALGGYLELIEHINAHRYYLAQERKAEVSGDEAVGHWYDSVYTPLVQMIREHKILERFPGRTEADLALWIMQHRRSLSDVFGFDPGAELATLDYASQFGKRSVLDTVGSAAQGIASGARIALIPPRESPPLELLDFLEWSRLDQICPDANVRMSGGDDYSRLRGHILDHRYFLSQARGYEVPLGEAIEHWCHEWYTPVTAEIRTQGTLAHFPGRTETDLFLWIMDHLHYRRQTEHVVDIARATAEYTRQYGAETDDGGPLRSLVERVGRLLGLDWGRAARQV